MLSLPIGSVVPFAGDLIHGNTAYQLSLTGWLPCDGRLLDVAQFAQLYAVLGTAHGGVAVGKSIAQFRVPNLNGRFVRGVSGSAMYRHTLDVPWWGGPTDQGPLPPIPVDPDAAARLAPPGTDLGNSGDNVGSYQKFATARPNNPFKTDVVPEHVHTVPNVTGDSHQTDWGQMEEVAVQPYAATPLPPAGTHTHTVSGGDPETCPVNMAVSWIIRFA